MNEETKVSPRVFFARVDKDGKRYASGVWDDGTKVYFKNFRSTPDGMIADVDYQTNEQYENKQGNLVYRHKICGALKISNTKATLVIELNNVKERLTCEPRMVKSKKTGESMVVIDFGNGASLNPYVDDVMSDGPDGAESTAGKEEPVAEVSIDEIDKLVDDSLPFSNDR
jgi:hypothetical protein